MDRLKLSSHKRRLGSMDKTNNKNNVTTSFKGKVYQRKSEALSEYNKTLPGEPLPQPKDYEEIEY
jgi:hypothetical protein